MKHRSNVLRNFTQKENYGGYSGLAIYYDAATMKPRAYQKINGGEIVFSTDIPFCGSERLFCRSLRAATKSLSFSRVRIIKTKEIGEEIQFIDDGTWESFPCDSYRDDFEPYKFWEQNSVSNTWILTDDRELFYGIQHPSCEWSDSYENSVYAFQNNRYSQSSPSACVPNCLSYLHAIQAGDSSPLTAEQYENNMMTQYQQYAGQSSMQFDGIPTADVAGFAAYVGAQWGNFSVTDSYIRSGCEKVQMDYDQMISEGKYILTNVYEANLTNNTMKAHAVVIIGKTNTGKYIYRDPSDSTIYEGNYNQFGSEFDVAIKLN